MAAKEGFTIRTIPQQQDRVCNGCRYLNIQAGVRGHNHVTNSFSCIHADVNNSERSFMSMKGKMIHFNIEGDCITPDWCPFLKQNKNEVTN